MLMHSGSSWQILLIMWFISSGKIILLLPEVANNEYRLIVLYTTNDYVEHLEQTKFITFYSLWSFALLIGAITVLISILTYKFEKHQRSEHLANTKVGLQLTKTNDILSILLPKFIKEKISRLGGKQNDKNQRFLIY